MAPRLVAIAVAFVIIGTPLAADMCELVCAEHARHSIDTPEPASAHHHSDAVTRPLHHHHPDSAAAPAVRNGMLVPVSLQHGCGHLGAVVTESRELTRG